MCCTTTSQTDPPQRLHLLGANWRPWHLNLKLSLSQKGVVARQKVSPNLERQCISWAELHETGGLSATLAVNLLGRCRATRPKIRLVLSSPTTPDTPKKTSTGQTRPDKTSLPHVRR